MVDLYPGCGVVGTDGYPMIEKVAWSVKPGTGQYTRPVQLVQELVKLGLVRSDAAYVHTGRAESERDGSSRVRNPLLPRLGRNSAAAAVLSPAYVDASSAAWQDYYDDWSIAPDINPIYRRIAARTYQRIRMSSYDGLVTVNTPKMAELLGLPQQNVVPNGVDPSLGSIPITGDNDQRLLMLGQFLDGRTDWGLIRRFVFSGRWTQLVIGAPGTSTGMASLLADVSGTDSAPQTTVVDWLSMADIAAIAGANTVCLIPHLVNDYTCSQDIMKAYQFAALGLPVVLPDALTPSTLQASTIVRLAPDQGPESVERSFPLPDDERKRLCAEHSWESRARRIVELFEQREIRGARSS